MGSSSRLENTDLVFLCLVELAARPDLLNLDTPLAFDLPDTVGFFSCLPPLCDDFIDLEAMERLLRKLRLWL